MALGPDDVADATRRAAFVRGSVDGKAMVTTRTVLEEEKEVIAFARDGRLTSLPLGQARSFPDLTGLNRDQCAAVTHVLTSADRLMIVRGGAGTGKTTLMAKAVEGIEGGGGKVHVFAPTSAARDVLRNEGFQQAETLQRLLNDQELQQQVAGSVLWVDEAGLISVPEMAKLTRLAERGGCRIVLSGDTRQHSPVERGDALRLLENASGHTCRRSERDRAPTRRVSRSGRGVSAGEVEDGFHRFEAMGAVIEDAIGCAAIAPGRGLRPRDAHGTYGASRIPDTPGEGRGHDSNPDPARP